LQVGSVRVTSLATPFAFIQRLCWRKGYLETIEGVGLFLSVRLPVGMADRGDVFDPELTFSLVLTARMLADRMQEGKGVG